MCFNYTLQSYPDLIDTMPVKTAVVGAWPKPSYLEAYLQDWFVASREFSRQGEPYLIILDISKSDL